MLKIFFVKLGIKQRSNGINDWQWVPATRWYVSISPRNVCHRSVNHSYLIFSSLFFFFFFSRCASCQLATDGKSITADVYSCNISYDCLSMGSSVSYLLRRNTPYTYQLFARCDVRFASRNELRRTKNNTVCSSSEILRVKLFILFGRRACHVRIQHPKNMHATGTFQLHSTRTKLNSFKKEKIIIYNLVIFCGCITTVAWTFFSLWLFAHFISLFLRCEREVIHAYMFLVRTNFKCTGRLIG